MKNEKTFQELLHKIDNLIDVNHHTTALIVVAKYYELKVFEKTFNKILDINIAWGYMDSYLITYRTEMRNKMYSFIPNGQAERLKKIL
jgi:hypothetical protein